jgi:hypothetical protein
LEGAVRRGSTFGRALVDPTRNREDRVGGMHEDCRRFADRLLRNGETGRRRLEIGFRFRETFLRHTDCCLDEEDNNFAGGKHFLQDCENNLRHEEDLLDA